MVESLITGKDRVVRGANVRVIAKGKPVQMARPVFESKAADLLGLRLSAVARSLTGLILA